MPFEPFEQVPVGQTTLTISRLGFGSASIAGLFSAVSDDQAMAMLQHTWDLGVRHFDTAPLYGFGLAERRLGGFLRQQPRDSYVLSTKVGRLLRRGTPEELAAPAEFHGVTDDRPVWDFSRDGVRRSLDASLERLGSGRIDIVYLHDRDDHWQQAIDEAYPALHVLRAQGVIGAIGAGMNQAEMLSRFVHEADMDVFLCAGRYTLLDQSGLVELLPACEARGSSLVIGGLLNSGILADPSPGARFDYAVASPDVLARAQGIREVCERHDVPLLAAAMQFPLAHPRVASILAGVRKPAHLDDYPPGMRLAIPDALWAYLRAERLIDPAAPVPTSTVPSTAARSGPDAG
ncbi:MAG: aldo/keto reductase [Chloroflexi bacterium]|nr:aldo/keto reductase [Chloroflexota bacterium]